MTVDYDHELVYNGIIEFRDGGNDMTMTIEQAETFNLPIDSWPSKELKNEYWQPDHAYFPDTHWFGDRCFIFDNVGNVVIFDYQFDGKIEDKKEMWKRINERQYYMKARSPNWIDKPSGHAKDNIGFIVYPMYKWVDALIAESNVMYTSAVLKTLVNNDMIHSYTV